MISSKLEQGVDHDYLTDKDEVINKFNEIRQKVAEIDGKTLLLLKVIQWKELQILNLKYQLL
ncbi:hypothetical protein NWE60_06435 [Mycoplasmopsis felis]|nr:hypothetical protein [Mycoplasmopsis felis]WAM01000.1 hypothetical protein NWE60_06435 [Mycoplasmopsis felis]